LRGFSLELKEEDVKTPSCPAKLFEILCGKL